MPAAFKFPDFSLDSRRFELRRGEWILKLEKIPMELLILLAEREGELVSRDEIVEKLWGKDVFIEADRSVNTAGKQASRRAPGRSRASPPHSNGGRQGLRFHRVHQPDAIAANARRPSIQASKQPSERRVFGARNGRRSDQQAEPVQSTHRPSHENFAGTGRMKELSAWAG